MRRAIFALAILLALAAVLGMRRWRAPGTVAPRSATTITATAPNELEASPLGPSPEPPDLRILADEPRGTLALRGRVVDEGGHPVAGARVAIDTSPRRTVESEPDGSFVFTGLLPRTYAVGARRGPLVATARELQLASDAPPITLVLREAPKLEALVLDATDQRPLASVRVEVEQEEVFVMTDRAGKAIFEGLSPGRYVISATREGYAKGRAGVTHRGGEGASPVILLLSPGATAYGRVVDTSGEAVSDATVRVIRASVMLGDEAAGATEVKTDTTGFWMISAIAAGTFRFAVAHPEYAPALSEPVTLDGREPVGPIVVTVEKGARLTGRVLSRSGVAVPFALVEARSASLGIQVGMRRGAFADAQGRFTMTGLPRAELQVEARAEIGVAPARPVELRSGEASVTLVVVADGLIAGVAVGARGEAIAGAQVVAIPDDRALLADFGHSKAGRYASGATNDRGAFRLRGLAAGSYRLRASKSSSPEATQFWLQTGVLAQAGDEDVRIVVEEGAKLKGNVELARGSTPQHFTVGVGISAPTSFTGTRGAFAIDDVPPGRHTVTVGARGAKPRLIEGVELRAGEATDLGRIALESGLTLEGTVVDREGAPVAEATVLAGAQLLGDGRRLGSTALQAKTDPRGRFSLEGIAPGPLTVLAEHGKTGRSAPLQLTLDQEPPPPVELRLGPVAALTGHVTSQGKPVDRAAVVAAPNGSTTGRLAVNTQADGQYQFERLSQGDYLVTAVVRESATVQILQTVSAKIGSEGATADIDVARNGSPVVLDVRNSQGQPMSNAQVFLSTGNVRASTLSQLESAMAARGPGQTRILLLLKGGAVSTENVPPGPYSVCVVPVPGDPNDASAMQRVRQRAGDLAVTCSSAVVESASTPQRIALQVGGGS